MPLGVLVVAFLLTGFLFSSFPSQGQVPVTIRMGDIFFEPGSFRVEPGENVTLRVINDGFLQHTFTLFAEANASVPVDDNAALQDFHAVARTIVDVDLDGGQEATVNFTVPATVGVYTFVCMVPFHSVQGMFGAMFVGTGAGDGDIFGGIGIVQGLLIVTLIGTVVFAVIYHVRSTRP